MPSPLTPTQKGLLELIPAERAPLLDDRDRGLGVAPQQVRERLLAVDGWDGLAEEARSLTESLVLLWYDHLDASHTISQSIESPAGSYLHGMMHRREGDFWNSKYWMRRAAQFDGWDTLGQAMRHVWESRGPEGAYPGWLEGARLDGAGFVDACERAASAGGTEEAMFRALQQSEYEAFLLWVTA